MKKPKVLSTMNRCCLIFLAGVLSVFMMAGCGTPARYSAAAVRTEYAGVANFSAPAELRPAAGRPAETLPAAPVSMAPDTAAETETPLTLSKAIEMALANNPGLLQAVARMAQARAMQSLADAAFWPAVGAYTEYMQGDAPSAYLFKTIDQRQLPQNLNFNDPGWFENFETGVSARMNLFNGGQDFLARSMAEQDTAISKLDRQSIVNELTSRVIAAFYDVLSAEEFADIAETSVATVSEQLRIAKIRFEGGGALKSDVLSLKVRLAQAEEALLESHNRCKLARAALAHLMGFDPGTAAAGLVLVKPAAGDGIPVPDTYEDGILYAFDHRPELEKIRKQIAKSRMGLDMSKSGYLPRIDVMGKYYVDDPHMDYHHDRDNWTAAVMLNWDLFAGFSTRARIEKADAVIREMLSADREAMLNVKLDVRNAYLNLAAARARYKVAASSVENAEESFRLVKEYYQAGAVTITRYLGAELDRNRAGIRSTAAFYDTIKATADFARAIGMLTAGQTAIANP